MLNKEGNNNVTLSSRKTGTAFTLSTDFGKASIGIVDITGPLLGLVDSEGNVIYSQP